MIMSIRSPSLNAGHLCRRRSDEADVARGQIKHLARGVTRGHHCRQRRSAAGTAFGIMINHNVRRHDLPQGLARMPLFPPRGLPDGSRKLLVRGGFFTGVACRCYCCRGRAGAPTRRSCFADPQSTPSARRSRSAASRCPLSKTSSVLPAGSGRFAG